LLWGSRANLQMVQGREPGELEQVLRWTWPRWLREHRSRVSARKPQSVEQVQQHQQAQGLEENVVSLRVSSERNGKALIMSLKKRRRSIDAREPYESASCGRSDLKTRGGLQVTQEPNEQTVPGCSERTIVIAVKRNLLPSHGPVPTVVTMFSSPGRDKRC
jgi:hypothetical protein